MNGSEDSISESERNYVAKQIEKEKMAEKIKNEATKVAHDDSNNPTSRINFLLEQTQNFASFVMFNKKKNKEKEDRLLRTPKSKKGKASKRDQGEDSDLEEEPKVSRLYYQPSMLSGGQLTDYQMQGLNWLINLYENQLNGILADEMGLGKTIQSIAFMTWLKQYKKLNGKFLVIVPKSTMPNWMKETRKWCPALDLCVLNPVKEERETMMRDVVDPGKFEVLLTSYEGMNICMSKLKKIHWSCVIIDEAHRIKNEKALLSKNVRELDVKFRLLVTGTPLQNNMHELWALLNFLLPELFNNSEDFDNLFKTENTNEDTNAEIIHKLHQILKHFLLRRTKSEVETRLPPKKEIHIKIGMTEVQKSIYRNLLKSGLIAESTSSYKNILMQLRKCCNHPYLFDGVEDPEAPELGEHLIDNSSKMKLLDKLLVKLKTQGSQVLIFSQMTRMLNIIEDYCTLRGYTFCRIDGDTSLEEREYFINEFTKDNSNIFLFLLSTRAGGLGLNLMTADTVVLYDSDWNPQVDLQAMDRVHRIGQKNNVLIYRFITENTIEEKIIERQAMRLKMDSLIIQQGRNVKQKDGFSKEQMKEMIQYGAHAIFKSGNDFQDEEIDIILERGEVQTNKFMEEAEKQAQSKANLLFDMDFSATDLYQFENENYLQKRREESERIILQALNDDMDDARLNRRERNSKVTNYNLEQNFEQILAQNRITKKKVKTPKVPFYHLYDDRQRITEIKQNQINHFYNIKEKLPEGFDDNLRITDSLDEREAAELLFLLDKGFPDFDRKEYELISSTIEEEGWNCIPRLVKKTGKDPERVEAYVEAFKRNFNICPDGCKVVRTVEKREKVEQQKRICSELIEKKLRQHDNDFEEIEFMYPNSSKHQVEFSVEEDRFLLSSVYNKGYGSYIKR